MVDVHFIRQKEPLGLGHATFQARKHVGDEPFAVLLGDEIFTGETPCLSQVIEVYERTGASVVAVREVERSQVRRYGIIDSIPDGARLHRVHNLVEKPSPEDTPSNLAIGGRYVLDPEVFDILATLPPGRNGEIQLTDALQILVQRKPIMAVETLGRRYDVGEKLGYVQAMIEFALQRVDLATDLRRYLEGLLSAREGVGPLVGE